MMMPQSIDKDQKKKEGHQVSSNVVSASSKVELEPFGSRTMTNSSSKLDATKRVAGPVSPWKIRIPPPIPLYIPKWIDEYSNFNPSVTQCDKKESLNQSSLPLICQNNSDQADTKNMPISKQNLMFSLPHEIFSQILSNLSIRDIISYSLVSSSCREASTNNDYLWKLKFEQRWYLKKSPHDEYYQQQHSLPGGISSLPYPAHVINHYPLQSLSTREQIHTKIPSGKNTSNNSIHNRANGKLRQKSDMILDSDRNFWKECYRSAYANPHDLWITHWNCVAPMERISAGRTVIPDISIPQSLASRIGKHSFSTDDPEEISTTFINNEDRRKNMRNDFISRRNRLMKICPVCRHHPLLQIHSNGGGLEELNIAIDKEASVVKNVKCSSFNSPVNDTNPVAFSVFGEGEDSMPNKAEDTNIIRDNPVSYTAHIATNHFSLTPANKVFCSTQNILSEKYRKMNAEKNLDICQRASEDGTLSLHNNLDGARRNKTTVTPLQSPSSQVKITSKSKPIQPQTEIDGSELKTIDQSPLAFMYRRRRASMNAFRRASTFNRMIDIRQYRSSGINFLTDAIFFSTKPSHDRIQELSTRSWISPCKQQDLPDKKFNGRYSEFDKEQLQYDEGKDTMQTGKSSDTTENTALLNEENSLSTYSWHIIQMTNPDFARPMTFRIFIQQTDCFTAYPSEGFLNPGESCYCTLGVRSNNQEFPQNQTAMPHNGFAIQYLYCPSCPCVPDDFWEKEGFLPDSATLHRNNHAIGSDNGVSRRIWTSLHSESEMRTIYISVHVNNTFSFDEFQNVTLSPFEFSQNVHQQYDQRLMHEMSSHLHCSKSPYHPISLMLPSSSRNENSRLGSFIRDFNVEMDVSNIGFNDRSEKNCIFCGNDWGVQSEHFGSVFILRKAMCDELARHRSRQMLRLTECLRMMSSLCSVLNQTQIFDSPSVNTVNLWNRLYQLLFHIHELLRHKRQEKHLAFEQRERIQCYEAYETAASLEFNRLLLKALKASNKSGINNVNESKELWQKIVLHYDGSKRDEANGTSVTFSSNLVTEEPLNQQLNGICNLGKPEDPNHPNIIRGSNERIDVFKGNIKSGLASAIAMIIDPQSLLNQGVYNKVPYPGTIAGPRWLLSLHEEDILDRQQHRQEQRRNELPFLPLPFNAIRLFESIWTICEYFGFSINDEQTQQLLIDRRILIATQWLSNTLMIFPLLCSLIARWALWVSPEPFDHSLSGLPHYPTKKMRYLTSGECGICAILVAFLWLALGRQTERHICRTYYRAMVDYSGVDIVEKSYRHQTSFYNKSSLWFKKQWDYLCPFVLQKIIFMPSWNKRSQQFINSRILKMRGRDCREDRSIFYANDCLNKGDRIFELREDHWISNEKLTIIFLVGAGSFFTSSPHYVLNLCTIFFCSISMGLTLSLNYMEISQAPYVSSVVSKFAHMRFHVALTLSWLIGQLVGSSGGILFLAEFVVTSVGLLVGGAATISTNAIESWFRFFGLSSTAFWGYLLARVGLSNSIRQKECVTSSALLFVSFCFMLMLWIIIIAFCTWDLPPTVMILHTRSECKMTMHAYVANDSIGGCNTLS